MVASRDHILALPKAMLGLRILQLSVALGCLGLSAYGVTFYVFDGDCLMLFTVRISYPHPHHFIYLTTYRLLPR